MVVLNVGIVNNSNDLRPDLNSLKTIKRSFKKNIYPKITLKMIEFVYIIFQIDT